MLYFPFKYPFLNCTLVAEIWGWGGNGSIKAGKALALSFHPPHPKQHSSCIYFTFRVESNLVQIKDTEVNQKT